MRGVVAAAAVVAAPMLLLGVGGGNSMVPVTKPAAPDAADAVAAAGAGDNVPAAYRALVEQAGRVCVAVPAPIIAAQLDKESGWNPRAVSPAGAQGIAQFMPGTWASAGVDGNRDGKRDPFDPADAIPAQARLMCALAKDAAGWVKAGRVRGDVLTVALAAYNAGPGNVLKYRGVPPFAETRSYVTAIPAIAKAKYTTAPGGAAVVTVGGWGNPLPKGSYRLSSRFGPRSSPGGIGSTNHGGVDMAAPRDTPIYAAHAGRVTFAGPAGGYGHLITVEAAAGGARVETKYAHMYSVGVKAGQTVKAGQRLAGVGSDGNSTGNHLHFEVLVGGRRVDPVGFLAARGVKL